MIGDRKVQVKEISEGPEEPLGLAEREAEDDLDRQSSLDGQVRVGPLTVGPSGGWRPPAIQRGFGESDRKGATLPESGFVVSPVLHSVTELGVLVLAAVGIRHRGWLQVGYAGPSRCGQGRSHAPTPPGNPSNALPPPGLSHNLDRYRELPRTGVRPGNAQERSTPGQPGPYGTRHRSR